MAPTTVRLDRHWALDQAILRDGQTRPWKEIAEEHHVSKATFYRRARALGVVWPRKYPDEYYELSINKRESATRRTRYWADPEHRGRVIERAIDWARNNRAKAILRNVRHRAKKLGLPFDLTEADIHIPERCPVLGIPLVFESKKRDASISVDRFIPERGYTKDNISLISWRANRLKSNATPEELETVAAWMRAKGAK